PAHRAQARQCRRRGELRRTVAQPLRRIGGVQIDDSREVRVSSMQSDNLAAATNSAASPGARLRVAREARGESVHEVAFAIKLSPRQVEALEKDDFAALPGMAFVRGFARNYARYLGLDAAPLLDGIERMGGADQPDLSPIRNADG